MKKLLILMIGLNSFYGKGQVTDTIFTNEHHNVALFFPEKIRQAVVGAENFVFSYNQEHPQFFGLLKGTSGKNSNLLAITLEGEIYSFVIKYKENLPRVTYFLSEESSVGNEQPVIKKAKEREIIASPICKDSTFRKKYHENLAAYYSNNTSGKLKARKNDGIVLQVNGMIYYRNEVYIVFEVANRSKINFEPEYLRVFLSQGNRKKNASYQKLLQEPVLTYNLPEIIFSGQRKRFVYVLPKFTIGARERVGVELREKNGNRLVKLNIKE